MQSDCGAEKELQQGEIFQNGLPYSEKLIQNTMTALVIFNVHKDQRCTVIYSAELITLWRYVVV